MEQFKILTDLRDYIKKLAENEGTVFGRPLSEGAQLFSKLVAPKINI